MTVFKNTLILVFVNENCFLCICFTELYFFHGLSEVSLAILIAHGVVCFLSFMNTACRSTQNTARIKRFLRFHIAIKPLNKKNKNNQFFIMLKRNSINFHCKIALVKVGTGWPYR